MLCPSLSFFFYLLSPFAVVVLLLRSASLLSHLFFFNTYVLLYSSQCCYLVRAFHALEGALAAALKGAVAAHETTTLPLSTSCCTAAATVHEVTCLFGV